MSGAHETQASMLLSETKAAAASKARGGVAVLDLARLDAGVEQQVVDEVLGGAVLGVDDGLALEIA